MLRGDGFTLNCHLLVSLDVQRKKNLTECTTAQLLLQNVGSSDDSLHETDEAILQSIIFIEKEISQRILR